jgi:hypothetical protein
MTADVETAPPKPPRGLHQSIRREWFRLAKDMQDQGINPHKRVREMGIMIDLIIEERELDFMWNDVCLADKLAISRRTSSIQAQKLKLLKLLFMPNAKSGDST